MNDLQYLQGVDKLLQEVLSQAGGLVIDFGNINAVAVETTTRIRDATSGEAVDTPLISALDQSTEE